MRTTMLLVVALLAVPMSAAARADTLDVPTEYPAIQAAIVAAAPGDTVLVAPGTYFETIDFLGKAITVQSSGGATVTTIDGGGAGSVVTFQSLETQTSVLQGFRITGGSGSDSLGYKVGGGIKIANAGPKLIDCHVVGNSARDMGGGVYLRRDKFVLPPAPLLVQCNIEGNSTTGPTSGFYSPGGGGIAAHFTTAILADCRIASNTTHGGGGGLAIIYNGGFLLSKCVIENNQAVGGGGGLSVQSAHIQTSYVEVDECIVRGNVASSGGGIAASLNSDTLFLASAMLVSRTELSGNSGNAVSVVTDHSGAFASFDSCLIVGNVGIGMACIGAVNVWNCTIVGNQHPSVGGLSGTLSSSGRIRQCIIWGNSGAQVSGSIPGAMHSDIQGGFPGPGNIDIDPHFIDPANGDYHLAATSACVDAGDPAWTPGGTDIDGDPRVLFGRVDIGADEATIPAGPWTYLGHALAGAGGAPSLVGTGDLTPGSPMTLALQDALPNTSTWIVVGTSSLLLPFKGGVMVPTLDMLIGPVGSGPSGGYTLGGAWPMALPPGFVVRLQTWIADASGPAGFTASNGLAAESQ